MAANSEQRIQAQNRYWKGDGLVICKYMFENWRKEGVRRGING